MLNNDQQYGFDVMDQGRNVFITGEAGTGKSYLLNEYIDHCYRNNKKVMAVAPTGIAALNIGGVTVHRAFRAPIGPLIEDPQTLPKTLLKVDVLICDEISMCRIDLFDYMLFQVIRAIKYRRDHGKKDIQIIVVGDFFQLPPVMTPKDRDVLITKYDDLDKGFAFESKYWDYCNFVTINLKQPMRQNNEDMLRNLNRARVGNTMCIDWFNRKSSQIYDDNVLSIVGKNATAEDINVERVNNIDGPLRTYIAEIDGQVKDGDKVAPEYIDIKVGARVIMLINDTYDKYSNGSFGTVKKLTDYYMIIEIDDTGETAKVEPYTWEILDYSVSSKGELTSKVIGTYKQFPIKIGYAITIHKSQGQTYDKVNIDPSCWDCGQLYVALSRCKDINNMHLLSNIRTKSLVTSHKVLNFYDKLRQ